eukprot:TRINITY_DN1764_c0_g2_i4.p1 TRINITY_DN1764_c0_g2~~TRINITY_DN1764_c0_g2_i4.p1  ORF type:complete len:297 (-),score=57.20 TRINITY_DN1764_c0_g2_i4:156-1046(-)
MLTYSILFFFQAEDGIRDRSPSRGLGDVYKRQVHGRGAQHFDVVEWCLQHIVAKEIYKTALNMVQSKYKKSKKEMMTKAFELFIQAMEKGSYHSFYYLAEMFETGDAPGGVELKQAYEFYLIAACFNSAPAYFKLAKFHREGVVAPKDPELEFSYTKTAAEMGLIEAQHNLACMYLEARIVGYDSLKALAWFTHAGAGGFVHSQYNAAKLFLEGSKDKKVKQNLAAALTWLERVQKSGQVDVERLLKEVVAVMKEERKRKLHEREEREREHLVDNKQTRFNCAVSPLLLCVQPFLL